MPQWNRIRDIRDIEPDFIERAHRMVWASAATVDARGRPISRVLHPIWESGEGGPPVGWIGTWRSSPKGRDIATTPFMSLGYVSEVATPAYAECHVEWADSPADKQHLWDLFTNAPPPLGFDPATIFKAVDYEDFGVLRLRPWRIQLADSDGTRRTWLA